MASSAPIMLPIAPSKKPQSPKIKAMLALEAPRARSMAISLRLSCTSIMSMEMMFEQATMVMIIEMSEKRFLSLRIC